MASDVRWTGPLPRWILTSGIPRSGTGWVHRIIQDLVEQTAIPVRDRIGLDGQRLDDFPTNAVGDPEDLRLRAALADWRTGGEGLRVAKTHYFPGSWLTDGEQFALCWVWRDLRGVIASTCHYARTGPARDVFGAMPADEAYRQVTDLVLPTQLAVLRHLVEHPPPPSTAVFRYATLHDDLPAVVEKIATHIGVTLGPGAAARVAAEHAFMAESGRAAGTEDRTSYHRMGTVGGWRTTLPDVARQRIMALAPDLEELQERMWTNDLR